VSAPTSQLAQRIILEVSKILAGKKSHTEALSSALQVMSKEMNWRTAAFWRVDEHSQKLYCENFFSSAPCPSFEALTRTIKMDKGLGLPGRVWLANEPVWIQDVAVDKNYPRAASANVDGLHAAFGFPVSMDERFMGVFEFYSDKISSPDQGLLEAFSVVGAELSQFFERHRIEEELALQSKLNEYAANIGSAVNCVEPMASILKTCADLTVEALDAGAVQIWTVDEAGKSPKLIAASPDEELIKSMTPPVVSESEVMEFVQRSRPYSTDDALNDPLISNKSWMRRHCVTAYSAHPLFIGSSLLGILIVFSRKPLSKSTADALCRASNNLSLFIARKNSEEKLLSSEALFREFANNVNEVFFVSSPQLNSHYYVSPAFEKVWGKTVEEVYAEPHLWKESIIPEHRERVVAYVNRLVGDEIVEPEIEYAIRRADGRLIWLSARLFQTIDKQTGTVHICGTVRDVTERKESENRVSEFYSMASHELKTPLTSIKIALHLLETNQAGALSDRAKQLVYLGRKECDRLIRLVSDMLDIKRIEVGKLSIYRQNCDASELVAHTIASMSSVAGERNIKLVNDVEPGHTINADKDRLVQILTNLLSNAIKFSQEGSEVRVSVEPAGEFIRFSVIDQGPGIRPEDQSKLFEAFRQVANDDESPKEGTGLGLAISKGIVEGHGGQIGLVSNIGDGSRFWFDMPRGVEEEATSEAH
jgi:PAS domain S-box-containing protein